MPASRATVYPRVYGETSAPPDPIMLREGLSPRVRGNRRARPAIPEQRGSIPACTGKPSVDRRAASRATVYPRVYGETSVKSAGWMALTGLSPRVRGNLRETVTEWTGSRSIPACTGKPRFLIPRKTPYRVYPRVYGETDLGARHIYRPWGLSPRVRGNRDPGARPDARRGSIPACTGKPKTARWSTGQKTVYPRVYGETSYADTGACHGSSLSPRVRRNLLENTWFVLGARSIPACTGKPACTTDAVSAGGVYPRVYGETRESCRDSGNWCGSIPACTGKPRRRARRASSPWVYPRVYGETGPPRAGCRWCIGLSPRVRGNLCVIVTHLIFLSKTYRSDGSPAIRRTKRQTCCASDSAR